MNTKKRSKIYKNAYMKLQICNDELYKAHGTYHKKWNTYVIQFVNIS